jgi:hypothetical protein
MPGLPEPDWLDLHRAVEKALAAFPDDDPAKVRQALVSAFQDGKIRTRARCPKWHSTNEWHPTNELLPLEPHLWDLKLIRLDWATNCFERSFSNGETYLFADIEVERLGLERRLKDDGAPVLLKGGITAAPHRRQGRNPGDGAIGVAKPTEEELVQWFRNNHKAGDKYEGIIEQCRNETGATFLAVKTAWAIFESPHKRKRGERDR